MNIPQGAVNAFLGYEMGSSSGVGDKLAGNVSLTNDQLYSEVKERVLDTAGGFVEYVKRVREEEDDDDEDDNVDTIKKKQEQEQQSKQNNIDYIPPTIIPNAELTAGEVVLLVMDALQHNNIPTINYGVEILFGFSSPTSQIKTTQPPLTPKEYADYLRETEYKVLLFLENENNNNKINNNDDNNEKDIPSYQVSIEKADYSVNGQKAFFTARLTTTTTTTTQQEEQEQQQQNSNVVNVNFILSSCPYPSTNNNNNNDISNLLLNTIQSNTNRNKDNDDDLRRRRTVGNNNNNNDDDEDDEYGTSSRGSSGENVGDSCWLIDSILIRPESMRRRRRQ